MNYSVFWKTTAIHIYPKTAEHYWELQKIEQFTIFHQENMSTFNENPLSLTEIILDFNVDGIPISRSSSSGFWVILFKIQNYLKV